METFRTSTSNLLLVLVATMTNGGCCNGIMPNSALLIRMPRTLVGVSRAEPKTARSPAYASEGQTHLVGNLDSDWCATALDARSHLHNLKYLEEWVTFGYLTTQQWSVCVLPSGQSEIPCFDVLILERINFSVRKEVLLPEIHKLGFLHQPVVD